MAASGTKLRAGTARCTPIPPHDSRVNFWSPPHGHSLEKGIHVLLALLVLHDPLEVHPVPCKGLRQGIVVVAKVIARLDVDKWHKADPTKG